MLVFVVLDDWMIYIYRSPCHILLASKTPSCYTSLVHGLSDVLALLDRFWGIAMLVLVANAGDRRSVVAVVAATRSMSSRVYIFFQVLKGRFASLMTRLSCTAHKSL